MYLCLLYVKENKHFKKGMEYNCRKIILGTLGFKLSFQKGRYKLHKAARFTWYHTTFLSHLLHLHPMGATNSTFWTYNSELNFTSKLLSCNPQPYVKLKGWLFDACGWETRVPLLKQVCKQWIKRIAHFKACYFESMFTIRNLQQQFQLCMLNFLIVLLISI